MTKYPIVPTFQELIAGAFAFAVLVAIVYLSVQGEDVAPELWTLLTASGVYILGSRTSSPS